MQCTIKSNHLVLMIVSVCWHWQHMYKEALSAKQAKLMQHRNIPPECRYHYHYHYHYHGFGVGIGIVIIFVIFVIVNNNIYFSVRILCHGHPFLNPSLLLKTSARNITRFVVHAISFFLLFFGYFIVEEKIL